ncbi:MAG: hypothetical protein GY754_34850 [bacterium]|nr:hypothetical protein [bacterium]
MFDYKELRRIISKYYKPGNSTDRYAYELRTGKSASGKPRVDGKTRTRFHVAFVEDNKDPDKLGRIKVRFPQWGEGFISQWIPLIRPFCGPEMGFWALPDIDDKVLCVFIGDNTVRPMAMGNIFSGETGIPVDDVTDNNIRIMTSPSGSKIIFDDTEGEEKLVVSMKEGKMRMVLDKAKGIQVVNELGDIKIKCRKLSINAGDTASIVTKKALKITAQKDIKIESGKGANFKASGDLIVKGQKIELKGNSGVTAQMKQIAAKDDQVVGVDTHIEMVPAGPSMVPTPIPNPYMGKLADKLSSDVEVKGKPAAVKGSKSKATPGHMPMPPGVQFQKAPTNEGEVTMGTVPTVLVNGKEVAVLGSMVKTCGDPMDMETCSIIAAGAAVFVPIVIPGLEYAYDKQMGGTQMNTRDPIAKAASPEQGKTPSLSSPKWNPEEVEVGEEVALEVSLTDQYDNANVKFSVWAEDADRAKDVPIKKLFGSNKGGKAEASWRPPDPDWGDPDKKKEKLKKYESLLTIEGVQERINKVGFHCGVVDGIVDIELRDALKSFQQDQGIEKTGEADIPTRRKLRNEFRKKLEEEKNAKDENDIEDEKKYVFTANSFRCEEVEASALSLKRTLSEFEELKWMSVVSENEDGTSENQNNQDDNEKKEEEEIEKAEYGSRIKAVAKIKNVEDGEVVKILLYEKGCELENEFLVPDWTDVEVKDGQIEFELDAYCTTDLAFFDKDEEVQLVFKLKKDFVVSDESDPLNIVFSWNYQLIMDEEYAEAKDEYILESEDESYTQTKTLSDDHIPGDGRITLHFDEILPGHDYHFLFKTEGEGKYQVVFQYRSFKDLIEIS